MLGTWVIVVGWGVPQACQGRGVGGRGNGGGGGGGEGESRGARTCLWLILKIRNANELIIFGTNEL